MFSNYRCSNLFQYFYFYFSAWFRESVWEIADIQTREPEPVQEEDVDIYSVQDKYHKNLPHETFTKHITVVLYCKFAIDTQIIHLIFETHTHTHKLSDPMIREHIFVVNGHRINWSCHMQNVYSKTFIRKIVFVMEHLQENHML